VTVPVTVKVPTILRKHVDGRSTVEGQGQTMGELLDELEARYPGLKGGVVDADGLHRFVNVYVNGEDVRYLGALDAPVRDGDTVSILPAVAGGGLRLPNRFRRL
jgi:molybdopterin synthase sulfur carrier subunit